MRPFSLLLCILLSGSVTVLAQNDYEHFTSQNSGLGYHQILEADDGTTALEMLSKQKVGLIVSDWNMPKMSGLDLLKTVRADEALKSIPFLMVTAEAQKENVIDAVRAGADGPDRDMAEAVAADDRLGVAGAQIAARELEDLPGPRARRALVVDDVVDGRAGRLTDREHGRQRHLVADRDRGGRALDGVEGDEVAMGVAEQAERLGVAALDQRAQPVADDELPLGGGRPPAPGAFERRLAMVLRDVVEVVRHRAAHVLGGVVEEHVEEDDAEPRVGDVGGQLRRPGQAGASALGDKAPHLVVGI